MTFGSFGATTPATGGGFGAQGGATSGGFGGFGTTASAAPATPATGTGFGGFGAASTPAASGFGATTGGSATTPGFGGFGSTAAKPAAGGFGTPAATGGFGGFGTTPAPSTPAFGGFGTSTPAAAPTGTSSFSGFGTTPAKPATTGFGGFGTPSATTGATSSFGGFGAPAAGTTSSFGGFGAPATGTTPATTSNFGSFGSFGGSAAPNTQPTSGFGAPTAPTIALAPAVSENVCEFPAETMYNDLPAAYKAELDRTWKEMKQPMKVKLEEIARSRGSIFDDVHSELRRIHLAVIKVENEQRRLQGEIRPFLAELRQTSEVGRLQAAIGLKQIRNQGIGGALLASSGSGSGTQSGGIVDEDLPCKWYLLVAEQLSSRLSRCVETVSSYERQLSTRLQALEQRTGGVMTGSGRGNYGQLRRVGVQELVALMQEQAK